jgi:hypothetical protein
MNGHLTTQTGISNYMKPISAGLIAFGLDYVTSTSRFSSIEGTAIFASVVTVGSYVGSMIVEKVQIPVFIPSINGFTGKQFEAKVLEIVGTFGVSYGIDYALRGSYEFQNYDLMRKGAIVAASEVLSETVADAIIQHLK